MTVPQFLAFVEQRSDEERWELIDAVAIMTAPPTSGHQRIARNVERALNDLLARVKLDQSAEGEVGIEVAHVAHDRPEPDFVVVDTDIDTRARHADRSDCVVDILSKRDFPAIETVARLVCLERSRSAGIWST